MRDEKRWLDGREIKQPPNYFLGAAASPFTSEPAYQAIREEKKVNVQERSSFRQTWPMMLTASRIGWKHSIKEGFMTRFTFL
ncbi:MAG: hypothetical protein MZV64_05315 [Ignavibacteriales bacterium]|nr:hypothetical protein [Ignavibacteriales bacterium]